MKRQIGINIMLISCVAIASIATIVSIAIANEIDGVVVSSGIGAICLIAGWVLKDIQSKRRNK